MSKEKNSGKKGTIFKDALILFAITLIAGFALGFVHEITLPAIEAQNLQAKMEAYRTVFPGASEFKEEEALTLKIGEAAKVLESKGYTNITIDEALIATDEAGNKLGYVIVVTTQEGYGGAISLSLGYAMDGTVKGMEILSMNETAGLGAKAAAKEFKSQFADKKVTEFAYTKTGAKNENEIDALSGATITTRAVTNAVNSGLCFITDLVEAGN
ncbi:RnfABCDGE type electron transport complex subunit G [Anaerocolumna sedimenticola]|uniref:Ion-translocating oxidoreductase complex subunit G n=1 Tax=Anaerocolumna sedimenticola TaxID=2696063 RepID=A0A6P1TIV1_9FIRM|nr:RnfABCDGE type electron transport complex subunit G [Anaerocolumna sedimenticola]QHQ60039.1 RnfABCDGE type electron transport complex subunit G [Anaerocolumna sedimenticola]